MVVKLSKNLLLFSINQPEIAKKNENENMVMDTLWRIQFCVIYTKIYTSNEVMLKEHGKS